MSKSFSMHKCYFHPEQIIVKFCTNQQCTLPLCEKCVSIHEKQHVDQQRNLKKAEIVQYQTASKTALQKVEAILNKRKQQKRIVNKKLKQLKQQVIEQINKQFKKVQDELNFQQLEQLQQKSNKIKRGSIKNLIYFYAGDYNHYFKTDFQSNFQQKIMKSMVQLFTKIKNFISELEISKNMKSLQKQENNSENIIEKRLEQDLKRSKILNKVNQTSNFHAEAVNLQQKRYFSESNSKLGLKYKNKLNYNKLVRQKQNCLSLLDLRQGKYLNDLNNQQFTFKKAIQPIKQSNLQCRLDNFNIHLNKPNNALPKRNSIFSTFKTQNRTALKSSSNIQNIRSKYSNSGSNLNLQYSKITQQTDDIKKNRIMSSQQIRKSIEARIQRRHDFVSSPSMKNDKKQNFSSIKRQKSIQNERVNEQINFHQKRKNFVDPSLNIQRKQNQQVLQSDFGKNNQRKSSSNQKTNSRFKKYDYLKELSLNLQNSKIVKSYQLK